MFWLFTVYCSRRNLPLKSRRSLKVWVQFPNTPEHKDIPKKQINYHINKSANKKRVEASCPEEVSIGTISPYCGSCWLWGITSENTLKWNAQRISKLKDFYGNTTINTQFIAFAMVKQKEINYVVPNSQSIECGSLYLQDFTFNSLTL